MAHTVILCQGQQIRLRWRQGLMKRPRLRRKSQTILMKWACVHAQLPSRVWLFCSPMDCTPPGSSVHDVPGKNTGVGCHFLLQGIFPPQGSNSHLLHWQEHSLLLSHQGSPLYPLEWIYKFCKYKFCFPEFCDLLWQFNRTWGGHCGNLWIVAKSDGSCS